MINPPLILEKSLADVSSIRLVGLSIENFRAIGSKVTLTKLGRVNVLIGPNNVGKTSMLRAIGLGSSIFPEVLPTVETEVGQSSRMGGLYDFVCFPYADVRFKLSEPLVPRFVWHLEGVEGTEAVKYSEYIEVLEGAVPWKCEVDEYSLTHPQHEFVFGSITPAYEVDSEERDDHVSQFRSFAAHCIRVLTPGQKASRLAAHTEERTAEHSYSGSSLLMDFVAWSMTRAFDVNGDIVESSGAGGKLTLFMEFVRGVLGKELDVLADPRRGLIHVRMSSESPWLPLGSFGDGIRQIFTIAGALATIDAKGVLLLEEPESHLHPGLQRALCTTLATYEDVVTFMATHSNHIVDASVGDDIVVWRMSRVEQGDPQVTRVLVEDEWDLLEELGVRPSSAAMVGALIWVEGPSDALYLRAWIAAYHRANPSGRALAEGVDFGFAFTGGSNLDHFDGDDALIKAMRINPNSYLVVDRDAAPAEDPSKSYVKEVVASGRFDGRIWITDYKEIENYIPDELLVWAHRDGREKMAEFDAKLGETNYKDMALGARKEELGITTKTAKAEVARRVADLIVDGVVPWHFGDDDLEGQVGRLVKFLESCRF